MQSSHNFTVGGSLSVNCHGWQHDRPPVASSVESFRLLKADGQIIVCSRESESELFRLVLGGYGLFGVILDVDLRLARTLKLREHYTLDLSAESFNLFNRDNQRVTITSNGLVNSASTFVQSSVTTGLAQYPGYYESPTNFTQPNAAYAPRQVQLSVKLIF